jgi:hypothetical protein
MFVVEVTSNDEVSYHGNALHRLRKPLRYWLHLHEYSNVLSTWLEQIMTNSMLDRHFPECIGGKDLGQTEELMLSCFMQFNSGQEQLRPYLAGPTDVQGWSWGP